MKKITGKVALVTGSTAGLGRELALQLCRKGARVVLNGRDRERLGEAELFIRSEGFDPFSVVGDVRLPEDCRMMVEQIKEKFGRIDLVICNAGLGSGGLFSETVPEAFRAVFEINTLGSIYMARYSIPGLQESRGSLVFISSIAGLTGIPFTSAYSSSKMALTAIAKALRIELAGKGIHVGLVYAGFLRNRADKRVMGPEGKLQPTGKRDKIRLQSMEDAGRKILRLIIRRERMIVLSRVGKLLYWSERLFPWLVRWFLIRSMTRARETYEPHGVSQNPR